MIVTHSAIIVLLRTVARAAHPGPWNDAATPGAPYGAITAAHTQRTDRLNDSGIPGQALIAESVSAADRAFIATFNPATALSLLDAIESLRRDRSEAWAQVAAMRKRLEGDQTEIPF